MVSIKRAPTCSLAFVLLGALASAQTKPSAPTDSQPVVHQGVAVTLKVSSFEAARQQVISDAQALGGNVADSKVNVNNKGLKSGWMRIVVPADKLDSILPQVYSLGSLYGDKMLTADKTSEYEVLARRMDQLDKHQARLSTILTEPKRMRGSDILYIQERLFRAGLDQESLAQERIDLARGADSANVLLTMFEPMPVKPMPKMPHTVGEHVAATFSTAWISFRRFGLGVTSDLAFLLVYAVVWVPITIVAWLVLRKLWRQFKPRLFPPDRPLQPPAMPA